MKVPGHGRGLAVLAAILMAIGIALGAFAAHGLESRVTPELLGTFHTAVNYHIWHSLALLFLGLLAGKQHKVLIPALLFLGGILLFSGSLYLLVLTGVRQLGMVTPFGGLAFIAGWIWLAASLWRGGPHEPDEAC